jgi:hypothetical protein
MNLLIALDGKPHSQQMVDLVQQTIDLVDKQILLLHVLEEDEAEEDQPEKARQESRKLATKEVEKLLQLLAEPLIKAGAEVSTQAEYGPVSALVKATAEAKKANVIVCAPGKHTPQELLLKGSLTRDLMRFTWEGTLISARKKLPKQGQIVFLLDGTQESYDSLKINLPLLNRKFPLLLLASRIGFEAPVSRTWSSLSSSSPGSSNGDTESTLIEAGKILSAQERLYETSVIDTSFETWMADSKDKQEPALLFITRTLADTTHQAITNSPSEAMFLNAPCSTALTCFKSRELH